jgi:hypothetical protein
MKVTLKQIVDAREALLNLSKQKLPLKQSYNLSKVIRKANVELDSLNTVRQGLIQKHIPEGTEMTPELNQLIVDELNVALAFVVDIAVNPIDLSNINLDMTARDIILLDPFCIFETTILE